MNGDDDDMPAASKKGGKGIKASRPASTGKAAGGKSGGMKMKMPKGSAGKPPKVHVPGNAPKAKNTLGRKKLG